MTGKPPAGPEGKSVRSFLVVRVARERGPCAFVHRQGPVVSAWRPGISLGRGSRVRLATSRANCDPVEKPPPKVVASVAVSGKTAEEMQQFPCRVVSGRVRDAAVDQKQGVSV